MIHCNYCKDNKCGFKDILNCKHKELMDENANFENKLKEYIQADLEHFNKEKNYEKVLKPILDLDLSNGDASKLGVDSIQAIQEAKRLYDDLIVN